MQGEIKITLIATGFKEHDSRRIESAMSSVQTLPGISLADLQREHERQVGGWHLPPPVAMAPPPPVEAEVMTVAAASRPVAAAASVADRARRVTAPIPAGVVRAEPSTAPRPAAPVAVAAAAQRAGTPPPVPAQAQRRAAPPRRAEEPDLRTPAFVRNGGGGTAGGGRNVEEAKMGEEFWGEPGQGEGDSEMEQGLPGWLQPRRR
jgi:hypothetical protein